MGVNIALRNNEIGNSQLISNKDDNIGGNSHIFHVTRSTVLFNQF